MYPRKSNSSISNTSGSKKNRPQLGIFDMPNFGNMNDDDDAGTDDDDDLEAELLALTKGSAPAPKKPSRPPINPLKLNEMIKESLRDIPSDEEVSSGEDDPEILAELEGLQDSPTTKHEETAKYPAHMAQGGDNIKSLLQDRMKIYEIAEANAKASNDSAKARRMNRGITTLRSLLKQVDLGQAINEEDIPPMVSVNIKKPQPSVAIPNPSEEIIQENVADPPPIPPRTMKHSAPLVDSSMDKPEMKLTEPQHELPTLPEKSITSDLDILKERQNEYKKAAVEAKRRSDVPTALEYVKIVKQFDLMIKAAAGGSPVDLSSIPPSLVVINTSSSMNVPSSPSKGEVEVQGSTDPNTSSLPSVATSDSVPPIASEAYEPPKTVMEALNQRLFKFKESEESAKRENNMSKARRMGRIVKQYEDAIRFYKAGKLIPVEELPTPPGFAPIPVDEPVKPKIEPAGPSPKKSKPESAPVPPARKSTGQVTRADKQLHTLLERQKLFKAAALKAKQEGNLELAKEYLRSVKGFEPLIEASKSGLPVNLDTLPVPPGENKILEPSEDVIRLNDTIEGADADVFRKLLDDLQQQLDMCIKTRDHFKAMGDVGNANRFEQLAVQTKKDFRFVQLACQSNLRIPKFHYETKPFTIVQCNTDLTDNDVEVNVIQGINFNVNNPKSVDTYVKVIFPYPTDAPQQHKTTVIYDTNNPAYNEIFVMNIQRNNRTCKRIFTRNALKCEVWSKGGFFRSDALLGTVNVKLQPLETKCTLHDAYDLMDGRKVVGGKLEIKIRLRDPIAQKQIEQVQEKWLIIDT